MAAVEHPTVLEGGIRTPLTPRTTLARLSSPSPLSSLPLCLARPSTPPPWLHLVDLRGHQAPHDPASLSQELRIHLVFVNLHPRIVRAGLTSLHRTPATDLLPPRPRRTRRDRFVAIWPPRAHLAPLQAHGELAAFPLCSPSISVHVAAVSIVPSCAAAMPRCRFMSQRSGDQMVDARQHAHRNA